MKGHDTIPEKEYPDQLSRGQNRLSWTYISAIGIILIPLLILELVTWNIRYVLTPAEVLAIIMLTLWIANVPIKQGDINFFSIVYLWGKPVYYYEPGDLGYIITVPYLVDINNNVTGEKILIELPADAKHLYLESQDTDVPAGLVRPYLIVTGSSQAIPEKIYGWRRNKNVSGGWEKFYKEYKFINERKQTYDGINLVDEIMHSEMTIMVSVKVELTIRNPIIFEKNFSSVENFSNEIGDNLLNVLRNEATQRTLKLINLDIEMISGTMTYRLEEILAKTHGERRSDWGIDISNVYIAILHPPHRVSEAQANLGKERAQVLIEEKKIQTEDNKRQQEEKKSLAKAKDIELQGKERIKLLKEEYEIAGKYPEVTKAKAYEKNQTVETYVAGQGGNFLVTHPNPTVTKQKNRNNENDSRNRGANSDNPNTPQSDTKKGAEKESAATGTDK